MDLKFCQFMMNYVQPDSFSGFLGGMNSGCMVCRHAVKQQDAMEAYACVALGAFKKEHDCTTSCAGVDVSILVTYKPSFLYDSVRSTEAVPFVRANGSTRTAVSSDLQFKEHNVSARNGVCSDIQFMKLKWFYDDQCVQQLTLQETTTALFSEKQFKKPQWLHKEQWVR